MSIAGRPLMPWVNGFVFGISVGACIGLASEQIPTSPSLQSFASILGSSLVTGWVTFLFIWSRARATDDVGYFGFGTENLVLLAKLCIIGMGLHAVIGLLGRWLPLVVEHRALILGAAAGVYGALSSVWVMEAASRIHVR